MDNKLSEESAYQTSEKSKKADESRLIRRAFGLSALFAAAYYTGLVAFTVKRTIEHDLHQQEKLGSFGNQGVVIRIYDKDSGRASSGDNNQAEFMCVVENGRGGRLDVWANDTLPVQEGQVWQIDFNPQENRYFLIKEVPAPRQKDFFAYQEGGGSE